MKSTMIFSIIKKHLLLFLLILIPLYYLHGVNDQWQKIDTGLCLAEFDPPQKSNAGDSKITILKIDAKYYTFKLLCASEQKIPNMNVKNWCNRFNLIGAINAGMYQQDYKANVGYMKNFSHINNPRIVKKYLSVIAFNPINKMDEPVKIFDIDKFNIKQIIKNYNTVIQNLRLIKYPGKNCWTPQNRSWSEAALGQDKEGNILFIFCRSPFSMYELNNILLSLPIHLVSAQHMEGGPEASLYLFHNDKIIEKSGSYETSFFESDENTQFLDIPNVIGFCKTDQ